MHHFHPAKRSVRTALRESTEDVHERLHQARPFAALAEQRLDVGGYSDLVRRIAAFHFTVGPALNLDDSRRRLLARDLAALGSPEPSLLGWSAPDSEAGRLGCAYVVEGSAIGGRIIYGQLDYLFGRSADGREFFRGSEGDRSRWHGLCGRLETAGRRLGAVKEMVDGAKDAFSLFERALLTPAPAHV